MNSTLLFVFLCISSIIYTCHAGAVLKVNFRSFTNNQKLDFNDYCCDYTWWFSCQHCDTMFDLCFDRYDPVRKENHQKCDYLGPISGREYLDKDNVVFNNIIRGKPDTNNPIVKYFMVWNGKIQMKVNVWDDDHPLSHDKIDEMFYTIQDTPARTSSTPYKVRNIIGIRKTRHGRSETKLQIEYQLYCQPYYFTSACSVYCKPRSNSWGHYTCDPNTGVKVCDAGWEGPSCTTWWDDCLNNNCADTSTCVDGPSGTYTCLCNKGYTGRYCYVDIDECASSPCQSGSTCVDRVNAFECVCPPGFLGPLCDLHVCQSENQCENNGVCYGNGHCMCQPGFTGDRCETDLCDAMECQNGGTCVTGTCVCHKGYQGLHCGVDECSIRKCHHNGTCYLGECICNGTGYFGSSCQNKINECESIPCQHDGDCIDRHKGYKCLCQYPYAGENCELVQTTTTSRPPVLTEDLSVTTTTSSSEALLQGAQRNSPTIPVTSSLVGVAILVLAVILLVFLVRRRRKKQAENNDSNFDNPVYETGSCSINPSDAPPDYTETEANHYEDIRGAQALEQPSKHVLQLNDEDLYSKMNEVSSKPEPPPYSLYDNGTAREMEQGATGGPHDDYDIKLDLNEEISNVSDTERVKQGSKQGI